MNRYRKIADDLYRHHAEYGLGKMQSFQTVCYDCKLAADAIEELIARLAELEAAYEKTYFEAEQDKAESEKVKQLAELNAKLQKCVVRLVLERCNE